MRTPLGVYHITSRLDDKQLEELYGIGALPLNYPNVHDRRLGRTGSGIWLHGVPRESYARSPYATEGCVALANEDMAYLMRLLEPRRTPVIIADEVKWVKPDALSVYKREFRALLSKWAEARSQGNQALLRTMYSTGFETADEPLERAAKIQAPARRAVPQRLQIYLEDVSIFRWTRGAEVTVVNYSEVPAGETRWTSKRQYWTRENGRWLLFFDGKVG